MKNQINKHLVSRYFEIWNTGEVQIADEILSPAYVDRAHPEITSIGMVKESVVRTISVFPDFHISIDTLIGEEDVVALEGTIVRSQQTSKVMWFVRVENGKMVELRTGLTRHP